MVGCTCGPPLLSTGGELFNFPVQQTRHGHRHSRPSKYLRPSRPARATFGPDQHPFWVRGSARIIRHASTLLFSWQRGCLSPNSRRSAQLGSKREGIATHLLKR